MTAINMMVQPSAGVGYVMSDTAVTDHEGRMIESVGKIALGSAFFPYAIGISGNVHPVTVASAIGAATPTSINQLADRLPSILKDAISLAARLKHCDRATLAIFLKGVAWDHERRLPIGFIMTSDEALHPGAAANVFYETEWNVTLCDGSDTIADMIGKQADLCDPQSFDPKVDGLSLMKAQYDRGARPLLSGMETTTPYRIGGEVHLVEVREGSVRAYVLHDFANPIGGMIGHREGDGA